MIICFSKNKKKVKDRHNSHIHNKKAILPLIIEVLKTRNLTAPFEEITYDFGKIIGVTTCVKTTEHDLIYFRRREFRDGDTRFVNCREPEPCSKLTMILNKANEKNTYIMITAFVGNKPEPEIWDHSAFVKDRKRSYNQAKSDSEKFWANHAMIED